MMTYLIVPLEPVSGATFGITGFVFKFLGFSKSNLNIKSSVDDDIWLPLIFSGTMCGPQLLMW